MLMLMMLRQASYGADGQSKAFEETRQDIGLFQKEKEREEEKKKG